MKHIDAGLEANSPPQRRLCVVSTEPTPYKVDLYNALSAERGWRTCVVYARARDWGPGPGHDFRSLPAEEYEAVLCEGKGLTGRLVSAATIVNHLSRQRPDAVLVCGYYGLQYVAAILVAIRMGIPFALWLDRFNTQEPMRGGLWAKSVRNWIRARIWRHAFAVLVCGAPGWNSALRSGCPRDKLLNFPYVVDGARLERLAAHTAPISGLVRPTPAEPMILFSGRFIGRKGLDILLRALHQLRQEGEEFLLVAEGAGPLGHRYVELARELGLADQCLFVGFRQMNEHARLLSMADVVVVPSTDDPWGIVVHEAMLMGAPVCASDAVGAAIDRIEPGTNGCLFPSGDYSVLAERIKSLLHDQDLRRRFGRNARQTAWFWSPQRNADIFFARVRAHLANSS